MAEFRRAAAQVKQMARMQNQRRPPVVKEEGDLTTTPRARKSRRKGPEDESPRKSRRTRPSSSNPGVPVEFSMGGVHPQSATAQHHASSSSYMRGAVSAPPSGAHHPSYLPPSGAFPTPKGSRRGTQAQAHGHPGASSRAQAPHPHAQYAAAPTPAHAHAAEQGKGRTSARSRRDPGTTLGATPHTPHGSPGASLNRAQERPSLASATIQIGRRLGDRSLKSNSGNHNLPGWTAPQRALVAFEEEERLGRSARGVPQLHALETPEQKRASIAQRPSSYGGTPAKRTKKEHMEVASNYSSERGDGHVSPASTYSGNRRAAARPKRKSTPVSQGGRGRSRQHTSIDRGSNASATPPRSMNASAASSREVSSKMVPSGAHSNPAYQAQASGMNRYRNSQKGGNRKNDIMMMPTHSYTATDRIQTRNGTYTADMIRKATRKMEPPEEDERYKYCMERFIHSSEIESQSVERQWENIPAEERMYHRLQQSFQNRPDMPPPPGNMDDLSHVLVKQLTQFIASLVTASSRESIKRVNETKKTYGMNHFVSEPKEKNIVDQSALASLLANAQKCGATISNDLTAAGAGTNPSSEQGLSLVLSSKGESNKTDGAARAHHLDTDKKPEISENETPQRRKEKEIAQKLRKILLQDLAASLRHVQQHPGTQRDPEAMNDVIRTTPPPVASAMLDWIKAREAKRGTFVL